MLSLSLIQGCSKDNDEAQESATKPAATQTVVEQKADQPVMAEKEETAPQKAEPAKTDEVQPAVKEIKEDMSAEINEVTSQASVPVAEVTEIEPAAQDVIDMITIENQGYTSDKKGPVTFSHLKHSKDYGASCIQCHHVYKDGENLWKEGDKVEKCVFCHDPVEDKDKATKLQTAFHKNCKECHTEVNKEGKDAPSAKCNECHASVNP